MSAPVLQTIIGSTRPGRVGLAVGHWFHEIADHDDRFDAELIDLAEVGLPVFDEPEHPSLGRYQHQHTKDWSATISRADAFVWVVPEYNHSYNAAVKNAIDFLHREWRHKPAGFVSYGGVAAGTRAVEALVPVCSVLRMVPTVAQVNIPFVWQFLGDEGTVQANEPMRNGARAMLDELARLTASMRSLRAGAAA